MWVAIAFFVAVVSALIWVYHRTYHQSKHPSCPQSQPQNLCELPSCVRCNRNQAVLQFAYEQFSNRYSDKYGYERLEAALHPDNQAQSLFLLPGLSTTAVLSHERLPPTLAENIDNLEQNWRSIHEEYLNLRSILPPNTEGQWNQMHLINQGHWHEDNKQLCPTTSKLLMNLQARMNNCIFGYAFFSVLPPNTRIKEHRGPTNLRLRCHLALEVPQSGYAEMLVGGTRCDWLLGKCLLFDDSLPHSVEHGRGDCDRVVLLIDFWHPGLTAKEIECAEKMFPA